MKKEYCQYQRRTTHSLYYCIRKAGHGPGKLYCKQHAKKVSADTQSLDSILAKVKSQQGIDDAMAVPAQQEKVIACPVCGGEGVVDSGGQMPDGTWINMTCPLCDGKH